MNGLFFVLALSLVFSGCEKSAPVETVAPPLVRVYATAQAVEEMMEFRGSVEAAHRVRLGFKQGGVISELQADVGRRISKGQVVGRLDQVDTRAAVRSAQAGFDKAQRDLERAERLLDTGAATVKSRDDARSQFDAAEAALTQAREALARTELHSPVDGTVFARLAEPGETVGPGIPVLIIDGTENLIIRAGVTEKELSKLKQGQKAYLQSADKVLFTGRITSIAKTPNANDGLFSVEVTPDKSKNFILVPGALITMKFKTGTDDPTAIRIPLDALVHRRDQDFVFVIQNSSAETSVSLQPVTVSSISGKEVIIREGLTGKEHIVAEGAYFLQDKQIVRILE